MRKLLKILHGGCAPGENAAEIGGVCTGAPMATHRCVLQGHQHALLCSQPHPGEPGSTHLSMAKWFVPCANLLVLLSKSALLHRCTGHQEVVELGGRGCGTAFCSAVHSDGGRPPSATGAALNSLALIDLSLECCCLAL